MYELKNGKYEMVPELQSTMFHVSLNVSGADIERIVNAAIDGEISMWANLDKTTPEWSDKPGGLTDSKFATHLLMKGGVLKLVDAKDKIAYHELSLAKLLKGIGYHASINLWRDSERCIAQNALLAVVA